VVRINDIGPFARCRIIDLTPAAARTLGFTGSQAPPNDVELLNGDSEDDHPAGPGHRVSDFAEASAHEKLRRTRDV
jgi:rare lipoprotein A (peptidoglycan hydrolase)